MDFLLLISLLVVSSIAQMLFVRFLLAQLGKRLTAIYDRVTRLETMTRSVGNTLNIPLSKTDLSGTSHPNTITDDEDKDTIEFSEHNPLTLPNDIKFEIEGGDTAIPPGYSERAN